MATGLNQYRTTQRGHRSHQKGESSFGDSSGPLFSMYSDATEKEDNKMTDRWKADADGILFFVSPCVAIHVESA
jgi:hypothetical protein